jgi:hypothetical protein
MHDPSTWSKHMPVPGDVVPQLSHRDIAPRDNKSRLAVARLSFGPALPATAYNSMATELKVLLSRVPSNVKEAIAATAINAAISGYSVAATPRQFLFRP